MVLSNSDLAHFEEHGYVVVRGVLAEPDFAAVRREYTDTLTERAAAWRVAGRLSGGEEYGALPFPEHIVALAGLPGFDASLLAELDITLPHMPFTYLRPDSELHTGPAVLGLLRNPKVLDVVGSLVGDEIKASPNQHVRLKLPVRDTPTAFGGRKGETMYAPTMWHQDAMTQIPESDDTDLITCWIPLGDVDEGNGCLTVVPGGHRSDELLPWPMDADTVARLERAAVPIPVRKGDLVLLHKRLPHGSRVNTSDALRWSFDFRYFRADQPSDRPWFPNITVRSRRDPARELTDAAEWRRRWEDARAFHVAAGAPLPGRREFAQLVADALIRGWESGNYPVLGEEAESVPAAAGH
ncbi:hypothetical protein GTZ78_03545 [Streptomyces sp. SID8361]|uniref:phytanoyl-CoA dioxygenase family protein n=1 Tax=Streptomyces TaxID=1883 RepID=UPI00081E4AD0|nr:MULTISPECIES: phytanoyl-CoA dioxygenase family protein [unclassified Streptomyces]MYU09789.1 hypothetical protein [Streptomyces sp. SID8361]WHX15783.1 phytanoyl-CoA dioxygenase family protein [Streptomyces sp. NA07423]SCF65300.1 Ectoine hydroxylase-related dioxygenase, phytanoyl-CoA dioxygenase (PhyH) family [Streptomyces sp. MnatMP-M27]